MIHSAAFCNCRQVTFPTGHSGVEGRQQWKIRCIARLCENSVVGMIIDDCQLWVFEGGELAVTASL